MNRRFTLSFFIALSLFPVFTYAQQVLANQEELTLMAIEFRRQQEARLEAAKIRAKQLNMPFRMTGENGQIAEIQGITDAGELIYYLTDNLDAAKTVSTNKVWPGGGLGYSLTGDLVQIGEWDGGAVRLTHQELTGRVTQADGASALSDHATHVAGTMVASGVDANAKGMSYQGNLYAYDWNFDNSEMATAAGNGMLVSNHSYGSITGWYYNSSMSRDEWWGDTTLSSQEDYKFGYYDGTAQAWDQIARNAPYYLIVKSAGNDRGDNHSGSHYLPLHGTTSTISRADDGGAAGYDCISTYGNAKNILTIGAVNAIPGGYTNPASVVMSSFSGWGPTDDGRIKPDIVANGVGVYSSTAAGNTSYASYNGTSMASPNTSGSLALIQEHNLNENGQYLLSATLKGLVIHTADEAGSADGPDYRFGWGLLNTASAVQHISNVSGRDVVRENSLNNGQTYDLIVTSDGTVPLKATICWTDPAGTPVTASVDNPQKMLVNDLDLRIINNTTSGTTMPYILNPASPAAAAGRGDNSLDNVEQVYVAAPAAGTYTIRVTHKGTLAAQQNFSLLVSGGVLSPEPLSCLQTIDVYPYAENFETFPLCSSVPASSCALPPTSGWQNIGTDSLDWATFYGSTPTGATGPDQDFNPGTPAGKYVYLEATGNGFPAKTGIMMSPCFVINITDALFTFAYYMHGSNMGSLSVDINTGLSWSNVWFVSGDQGNTWQTAAIDLTAYEADTIQLRFRGNTGSGELSDIAIDDIQLISNPLACSKTIGSYPYHEDFESFSTCSTTPASSCALPVNSGWYNGSGDDIDWTTDAGGTVSGNTGPSQDYNPGTLSGKYLYTEASTNGDGFPYKEAILFGPCFDLGPLNEPELSFAYHMFGVDMGDMYVEIDTGNGWSTLWFRNGDQGDVWNVAYVSLEAYKGKIVQLRFSGLTGVDFESDMAIDDIRVGEKSSRVYCISRADNTEDSHISNVTMQSINNSTSNCTGYSDFSNITTELKVDSTYSLSVTTGDCDGATAYNHAIAVYIDWNNDGEFNGAGELVMTSAYGAATTTTGNITVPSNAATDSIRMRVVCSETTPLSACGIYDFGETEDYTIIISDGPPNDECINALPLLCSSSLQGTTVSANPDPQAFTCGTSIDAPGVWYKVTGNGQSMTANLCSGNTNYNTKLNVFSGNCSALLCVGGNDDFCATASQVTWNSVTGITYYILVQGNTGATGNFEISLQSAPASGITVGGTTTLCQGQSVMLTSDSSLLYEWLLNNNPLGAGNTRSISAVASGNYRVKVTDANFCTDTTASGVNVVVNPLPVVSATPAGPTTFCDGDSVVITSSAGASYQWFRNGTLIPAATANQYSALTPGRYNVVVTNANVCSDSAGSAVNVQVNPLPAVSISIIGSATFCDGDSSSLNTITGSAYQWYRNGILIPGANMQSYFAHDPGKYNVLVTNSNNCKDSSFSASTITVNPLPVVSIAAGGPLTFCNRDSVVLSATPSGTYQWYRNGLIVGGANQAGYAAKTSGSYNVFVTNSNNCSDSALTGAAAAVNPLPVVLISSSGDSTICENDSITLNASSGQAFVWMRNGLPLPGAITQQFSFNQAGRYNVKVTDSNGCSDTSMLFLNLKVDPLPSVQFDVVPDLCNTISAYTLFQGLPVGGIYSGTGISGDSVFDPSAAGAGSHQIVYTYTDGITGCFDTAIRSITVVNCVGVDEWKGAELSIYPNPTDGLLYVSIPEAFKTLQLVVTDMNGRTILDKKHMDQPSGMTVMTDLSNVSPGTYLLRISVDEKLTMKKLVVR